MGIVRTMSRDEVEWDIRNLFGESNMSPEEKEEIDDHISAIIVFGSSEKSCHIEHGSFIWKVEKDITWNDYDIAVIFDNKLPFKLKKEHTTIDEIVYNLGCYGEDPHIKTGKSQNVHYLLLTEAQLKSQIKNKEPHALSIQKGKRLYIRNTKLIKELSLDAGMI